MKEIKVYAYSKCDTCRKALRYLDKMKLAYQVVDITETAPSSKELEQMLEKVGDLRKLFNTSGVVYKELKLSEKLPSMSKKEAVALLASNGRLVKRPFVLFGQAGLLGFKVDDWAKVFSK